MNPETRTWLRRGALLAVALVAALLAWKTLRPASNDGSFVKGNGRIEAVEIDISTKTGGRVRDILVGEGDFVTTGQVLAVIDLRPEFPPIFGRVLGFQSGLMRPVFP